MALYSGLKNFQPFWKSSTNSKIKISTTFNSFIGLDGDILKEETKKISGEKNPPILDAMEEEDDDEGMRDDENLAELCQEGRLPHHEVLLKYGRPKNKITEKIEGAVDP